MGGYAPAWRRRAPDSSTTDADAELSRPAATRPFLTACAPRSRRFSPHAHPKGERKKDPQHRSHVRKALRSVMFTSTSDRGGPGGFRPDLARAHAAGYEEFERKL